MTTTAHPKVSRRRLVWAGFILIGVLGLGGFLLGALGLIAPGARPGDDVVYGLTFDRAWITVVALLALAAAVIGGRGLTRAVRGTGTGRKGAIVALTIGPLGVLGGVVNLALADGGPGTGNGVVGGVVALLTGLIAITFGVLTLTRFRRADGHIG